MSPKVTPTVTSSNPSVASAYYNNGSLIVSTGHKGTATITMKANDGSGVKGSFNIRVE
ncbi:MAG: hypothetical protein K5886_03375 [Lachnospiraceae bacterium]|nr:hypothetical protein [Lachnospiraceae bacterium]